MSEKIVEKKTKMGRPTDNPKPYRAFTRLDEKTNSLLNDYCSKFEVSKMEAIRRGIQKLEKDI